jgi:hypothetical protein
MLMEISIFNFCSDMSGDVWGVLIHHQWCLGRGLGPSVIKFFSKKNIFSRTSGNGHRFPHGIPYILLSILRSTLGPYSAMKRCAPAWNHRFPNGIPYILLSILRSTLSPYSAMKRCAPAWNHRFPYGIPYILLSILKSTLGPYSAMKRCAPAWNHRFSI